MTTTFKKRQKEMKRQDKARAKAERRLEKKVDGNPGGIGDDGIAWELGVGTPGGLRVPEFEDGSEPESQR
jgi:putative component of toxin-antitoxin plasmid stabilization module